MTDLQAPRYSTVAHRAALQGLRLWTGGLHDSIPGAGRAVADGAGALLATAPLVLCRIRWPLAAPCDARGCGLLVLSASVRRPRTRWVRCARPAGSRGTGERARSASSATPSPRPTRSTQSRLAINRNGRHKVSLNKAIGIRREHGQDVKTEHEETTPGLPLNVLEC